MSGQKLLCIHPSSELYGSDRSLLSAMKMFSASECVESVTVILPESGPLASILQSDFDITLQIQDIWVLRRNEIFRQFTRPSNYRKLYRSLRQMRGFEMVYINTVVIFDFIFAAKFFSGTKIIHIREIPKKGMELQIFRALVIWSGAKVIFNSQATKSAFRLPKKVHSAVVYNGYDNNAETTVSTEGGQDALRILMIGRINHWKGQDLLLDSLHLLNAKELSKVSVIILGSAFAGQEVIEEQLRETVARLTLNETVRILPFTEDPSELYRWSDIVVVPSRLPEPFGRVAIEAMSYSRAVVVAAHGGLIEIVEDQETGLHFTPNNAPALAAAIRYFLCSPNAAKQFGEKARTRFETYFTEKSSNDALGAAIFAFDDNS